MESDAVYCPQCGTDIFRDQILFPCDADGVDGHRCPNCGTCVPDEEAEYTREQQAAIDAWMTDGLEPPELTAEQAHIENVVASIEMLTDGAKATIEGIDALADLKLGGDMSALRAALEDVLAKWEPETPEWGEP